MQKETVVNMDGSTRLGFLGQSVGSLLAVALLAGLLGCTVSGARDAEGQLRAGWESLGSLRVPPESRYEEIALFGEQGAFREFQLYIEEEALGLEEILVRYMDGTSERFTLHTQLPAGSHTEVFPLLGHPRAIERIELGLLPLEDTQETPVTGSEPEEAPTESRVAVYGRR